MEAHKDKPQETLPKGSDHAENVQQEAEKLNNNKPGQNEETTVVAGNSPDTGVTEEAKSSESTSDNGEPTAAQEEVSKPSDEVEAEPTASQEDDKDITGTAEDDSEAVTEASSSTVEAAPESLEADTAVEETTTHEVEEPKVAEDDAAEASTATEETPVAEESAPTDVQEEPAPAEDQTELQDTSSEEPAAEDPEAPAVEEVSAEEENVADSVTPASEEAASAEEEKPPVEEVKEEAGETSTTTEQAEQAPAQPEAKKESDAPAGSRDHEHDHHHHHDDDHHHDDYHEEQIDYDHLDKDQIEEHLAKLSREDDIRGIDRHLKPIKARFDELFQLQRKEALDKFLEEGFEEDDFEYREDDQSQKIHAYLELLRDKRHKFYSDREKQKEENLKRKEEVLEKIRELIDGEESDISIKGVKELQEEWRSIGPVPGQHNKTLWANYNALLDRFYDARSIYFELKDLDRKKNLNLKLDICERAEALDKMENIKDAVVQLNELHEEFKHVGPIPRDEQENIWQRFKAASDKIYVKRKGFVEELKKSLHENLEKKIALADETDKFSSFDSDRISEWNKKTKEIQDLQRRWEQVGGVPRDKAKQVNKKFWGGFKHFFANKSAFFKRFEAQRDDNLKKKQELVQRAEELKESDDWQGTTEQYKKLQMEWKEIGPVPEKFRNSIYEEFKAACDHFFNRRREQNKEQNQEYEENYQKKQVVCNSIAELAKTEQPDLDLLYDLIDEYNSIGFVPRNVMRKIQERFNQVTAQVINSKSLEDSEREELRMNIEVSRLKGGPHANRKLFRKENSLKRKIDNLQNDINTWKTNMEFFASSKAADQLKKDFEVKIEKAQEELKTLRKELRLLND